MKGALSRFASVAILFVAAGCATSGLPSPVSASPPAVKPPAPSPVGGKAVALVIENAGFEDAGPEGSSRNCPPRWWCSMHSDPTSFRFASVPAEGRGRVLRGEQVKKEPWAMVTQALSAKGLEGRTVRVSVDVDASRMQGGASDGAGALIRVYAPGGRVVAAEKALQPVGQGWGRPTVEVAVPKGAELIDVGVVMYGGGIADFDNVAAEHQAK